MPQDPFILLSYINTKLRDGAASPEALCEDFGWSAAELYARLKEIGYVYSAERNAFTEV